MHFDSDRLDECCEELKGHTNWSYVNSIEKIKEVLKKGTVVVFYNQSEEEEN